MTNEGMTVRRRTLVRGAAWTAPAVAVAAAAPMAAASPQPCIPELEICGEYTGSACKHPGNPKYYHFTFCFTNDGVNDALVDFTKMIINDVETPFTPANPTNQNPVRTIIPSSVVVPADGLKHCYWVDGGPFGDSAQAEGSLTFAVNGIAATIPITVTTTPPCGTGADPSCDDPDQPTFCNPANDPPHPAPIGPCGVPGAPDC